jgi:hypothetical protein
MCAVPAKVTFHNAIVTPFTKVREYETQTPERSSFDEKSAQILL